MPELLQSEESVPSGGADFVRSTGCKLSLIHIWIEPRIEDVELDDSDYRVSGRYLPGYGELSPVISFSLQARRGVMYTAYIIGQANTDEIQVVIAANS